MSENDGTKGYVHTGWLHPHNVQGQEKPSCSDRRQNSPHLVRRYKQGLTCSVSCSQQGLEKRGFVQKAKCVCSMCKTTWRGSVIRSVHAPGCWLYFNLNVCIFKEHPLLSHMAVKVCFSTTALPGATLVTHAGSAPASHPTQPTTAAQVMGAIARTIIG